ncbi:MAG: tetratricopeptide repeat protein [Clostridia bacterium]|nr:tetratricopeptide repeat protein [Clostridia bacterium]
MIDPFDYKEPSCALCGGEDFYYPKQDGPKGRVPVDRIVAKLDGFFAKNDLDGAERHLTYWRNEAKELGDKEGELSLVSEQIGLYRKTFDKDHALEAVDRGVALVEDLSLTETISGATVLLNAATTKKAFGQAYEALPLYKMAADVYEKDLSPDDRRLAGLYNNRALAYADLGDVENAEKDYLAAIEILKKSEDNENEIAISYVNYAHLCEKDRSKSVFFPLDLMEKAYSFLTADTVKPTANHASACDKCAPSFLRFGMREEAEYLQNRAKEIYERA